MGGSKFQKKNSTEKECGFSDENRVTDPKENGQRLLQLYEKFKRDQKYVSILDNEREQDADDALLSIAVENSLKIVDEAIGEATDVSKKKEKSSSSKNKFVEPSPWDNQFTLLGPVDDSDSEAEDQDDGNDFDDVTTAAPTDIMTPQLTIVTPTNNDMTPRSLMDFSVTPTPVAEEKSKLKEMLEEFTGHNVNEIYLKPASM